MLSSSFVPVRRRVSLSDCPDCLLTENREMTHEPDIADCAVVLWQVRQECAFGYLCSVVCPSLLYLA